MYNPFITTDIKMLDLSSLQQALKPYIQGRKVLVMGSKRAVADAGLSGLSAAFYHNIPSNPDVRDVAACLLSLTCAKFDVVVAVGGGSALDMGKAVACMQTRLLDADAVRTFIKNPDYSKVIDVIAIPTTAGTGSDVTQWATVWDGQRRQKLSLDHPCLLPRASLLVPELTASMPPLLTLSTGLDALCQAFEAFWAAEREPVSQEMAVHAVELVRDNLPLVLNGYQSGRKGMMMAAAFAGFAFARTRTNICHTISYPLTLDYGMIHGLACAVTLAPVAAFNHEKLPEISRLFKLFGGPISFETWLYEIADPIQPLRLQKLGVPRGDLQKIAQDAMIMGRMDKNCREVTSADLLGILYKAY